MGGQGDPAAANQLSAPVPMQEPFVLAPRVDTRLHFQVILDRLAHLCCFEEPICSSLQSHLVSSEVEDFSQRETSACLCSVGNCSVKYCTACSAQQGTSWAALHPLGAGSRGWVALTTGRPHLPPACSDRRTSPGHWPKRHSDLEPGALTTLVHALSSQAHPHSSL